MATFKFVIKKAKGKPVVLDDGTITVYVKYTHNEKSSLFSSGVRVPVNDWQDDQRYPVKGVGRDSKNKRINGFRSYLEQLVADLLKEGKEPTAKLLRAVYKSRQLEAKQNDEREPIIVDAVCLYDKYLEYSKTRKTASTHRMIKVTRGKLEAYARHKRLKSISVAEIDLPFYYDFVNFLSAKQGLQDVTVGSQIKNLKSFLNWCENNSYPIHQDTKRKEFKVFTESNPSKVYLTQEELNTFADHNFIGSSKLIWVRDLFVFQCYTGLRVSDVKRLERHHIVSDVIQMTAYKTKKRIYVPLAPPAKAILEKYDYQLPKKSEVKYNLYLKEALMLAGISATVEKFTTVRGQKEITTIPKYEEISSHNAVKTFITLALQKGISPKSVAEMTGKTVNVIIKHYYGSNEDHIKAEMVKAFG